MKLLFAHDHIFYKFGNKFYSTGGLSKDQLARYTSIFKDVTILSRQKEIEAFDNRLTLSSAPNIFFVEVPNFKLLHHFFHIIRAKRIIEKAVVESDAVIARLPSSIGNIAVEMAKRNNKPFLIEVVGCPWDLLWNHSLIGKIVAPYAWLRTRQLVNSAPYALYVTEHFLQNRYPCKGKTVACSNVTLPPLEDVFLEKRLCSIESRGRRPLRLATVAALNVRYKGQQSVIKALAELKKEGLFFDYHLVGGGDSSYLRSVAEKCEVSDQVKIIGPLQHNDIPSFLDNVDIYIQPSETEGLPRALVEAMSRGCPALGSAAGGIPEILDNRFTFKKGSVEGICRLLRSFTPELMLEEARRNFQKAQEYDGTLLENRRREFFLDFISNSLRNHSIA